MMYFESIDGQFLFTDEMRKATGKRVRKLREAKGLSLMEVSDVIGYKSKSQLLKIENGEGSFEIAALFGIAELFQVPFSYLICGTSFDFPELAGANYLDDDDTAKLLELEELSFDLGLLNKKELRAVRRFVDKRLGLK